MTEERRYWLDEPKNVNKLVYALYAVCGGLILADLLYHKHGHYGFETWIGFHGWYGFVSCVLLVLATRVLRLILKRGEDYYDG